MNKHRTNTLTEPVSLLTSDNGNWDTLIAHLQLNHICDLKPVIRINRTYYDSFDWRLYRANLCLYRDKSRKVSRYCLQSNISHTVVARHDIETSADFYQELVTGPMQDKLSPILEMRALLPLASIQREITQVQILNKTNKTVVKLMLEHDRIRQPETMTTKFDDYFIRIIPMRGYSKHAHKIHHRLKKYPGLLSGHDDLFDRSMQVLGRVPGDYSSKFNIQLNAQERADRALQLILIKLYHTIQLNEPGIKNDIDSEFLHDYRVAIRRTRSALSQIKHVLPQNLVEKFRKDFFWLGTITNPCRDLDVHLLNLDTYTASLPENMRNDLQPLRDFLQHLDKREYEKLKNNLASSRYQKFKKIWSTFLDADLSAVKSAANSDKPVALVARKTIWRVYNHILKQGDFIEPASPSTKYHALRKTCKKLRYLMEFFTSLFPEKEIKLLLKTLRSLQDNLGEFQNMEVHTQAMKEFSRQMLKKKQVSSDTLIAINMLTENLAHHKIKVHDQFSELYRTFRNKKNQRLFKELFRPDKKFLESEL